MPIVFFPFLYSYKKEMSFSLTPEAHHLKRARPEAEQRIQQALDVAVRKQQQKKKKAAARAGEAWSEDALPLNGRFSQEDDDAFDKECIMRPLAASALTLADKESRRAQAIERIHLRSLRGGYTAHVDEPVEEELTEGIEAVAHMDDMMRKMAVHDGKEADERSIIRTRTALSTDLLRDVRHVKGDSRLAAIRLCLNSMGYTRSTFQQARDDMTRHMPA